MAEATQTAKGAVSAADFLRKVSVDRVPAYDLWRDAQGIPVHRGYYVDDVRKVEVGRWDARDCNAAFLQLVGAEGVTEARVTEILPGKTLPPLKFALDEIVYVADGRGLTTVWPSDGGTPKTFEWQKHSLFCLPRNRQHQLSNAQGGQPARLLHYNYLPISMTIVPDPSFYFDNPYTNPELMAMNEGDFYSEAKVITAAEQPGEPASRFGRMAFWLGNFFPDMRAWDRLVPFRGRGAGGHVVWIRFPGSTVYDHMSVFPSRTYKKAHRHGPGVVIVIPAGDGYSVMWEEGKEKVIVPWHEGSVFVPPNMWFHQHFNLGADPARYLAFHAPAVLGVTDERIRDIERDQIEYPNEDPSVRQRFESELGKRNLTSLMPEQAYKQHGYEWDYVE